jgi:Rrf2 family transcriptional regulator, cysteine metabolism repressor
MSVSQKCQYGVRALLELARHYGRPPISSGEIAAKQAVPPRFLENILNELKNAGMVEARRGVQGGFLLACRPEELTVGQVIRLIDGPLDPVRCLQDASKDCCPLRDRCALMELWRQAKEAVESVYDSTTFADLVERDRVFGPSAVPDYCI